MTRAGVFDLIIKSWSKPGSVEDSFDYYICNALRSLEWSRRISIYEYIDALEFLNNNKPSKVVNVDFYNNEYYIITSRIGDAWWLMPKNNEAVMNEKIRFLNHLIKLCNE